MTKDKALQQLTIALMRIKSYQTINQLRKNNGRDYGCGIDFSYSLECAYENILEEAKRGLRGIKLENLDKLK